MRQANCTVVLETLQANGGGGQTGGQFPSLRESCGGVCPHCQMTWLNAIRLTPVDYSAD